MHTDDGLPSFSLRGSPQRARAQAEGKVGLSVFVHVAGQPNFQFQAGPVANHVRT